MLFCEYCKYNVFYMNDYLKIIIFFCIVYVTSGTIKKESVIYFISTFRHFDRILFLIDSLGKYKKNLSNKYVKTIVNHS